jgi:hypothetical protein
MSINIRQKGAEGEREVMKILNDIVQDVRVAKGLPKLATQDLPFQRNQNQTAVGGDDLTNPFKLSIEVKRQEQLSINTWWKQCLASACRSQGYAILIFRQSRKPWRVMLSANLPINRDKTIGPVRVEIDIETFRQWFREYCSTWYDQNLNVL